jgi:hypothetical protein
VKAPTQAASALDLEHIHKLAAALTEMLKITREGVFVARRSAAPRVRAVRAAEVSAPRQTRTPSTTQQQLCQLVGEEFGEGGASWKVLRVEWSEQLEGMVGLRC